MSIPAPRNSGPPPRSALKTRLSSALAWTPFDDPDRLDELISPLGSRFALTRLLARVESVETETPDTCSLHLRPNWRWRGFSAGQHLRVGVDIDGRRHWRSYSLSSDPAERRRIRITVKRQPGGKVSNWLHDNVRAGTVLMLEAAEGDFVLAPPIPDKLLLIGAGSGVTPLHSLLQALRDAPDAPDVCFVHVARDREHAIFAEAFEAMARQWPRLRLIRHFTAESGRPVLSDLLAQIPDFAERECLLCGPESLMQTVRNQWNTLGLGARLRWEHYGLHFEAAAAAERSSVTCLSSGRSFDAAGDTPLLVEAERAGLAPTHGCRRGICHSCRYLKQSGIVHNLLTGEISSEPEQFIQLCVCAARSPLALQDL